MIDRLIDRAISEYGIALAVLLFACWQFWRQLRQDRERLWKIVEKMDRERKERNGREHGDL